ncbi:restriction endonuclease subunit S [uncultured Paracoccus sp.]|uniref:restriction endonuclease subunit S n=1 Tax=uncultured Paracoccus sp. TaxID=189685 RepID=UPI00259A7F20|nr:restriction endonuclease subunit S [uncultured Paracoccus sp.]
MSGVRTRIANVAKISSGKRPPLIEKEKTAQCVVPVIGGGGPSGFTLEANESAGVLITGRVGTLGKLHVATEACWPSDNALIIKPASDEIDRSFLRYALSEVIASATGLNRGAANPLLTQKDLGQLEIAFFPFAEQREIAAILGALDDKIEVNRKASATLEEMARALYRSWFVDFDPVWARLEGRQPAHMDAATAALFPDSFDDDGLPVGWKTAPYLDLVEIISGGTPKTTVDEYWNGDIPWYSVVDAPAAGQVFVHSTEKNISQLGFGNSAVKLVPRGTTIISARGTVGKIAMAGGDMVFNQSCYGLRGKLPETDAFVYFATERGVEQLQSMAHGSVFATITRKTFQGLDLAKPPIKLLKAYDASASVWLDRIHAFGLESRTLATLRDTLLPRLMSGELRVGEARELVEEVA